MSEFVYKRPSALTRFARNLRSAIRHQWWIATNERTRTVEQLERITAWGEEHFKRANEARDALHTLNVEYREASIDVLRLVADQIDCDPGCEQVGLMDPSTGVTECHLSDRGECPFDHACQLRELAASLSLHAKLRTPISKERANA